MKKVGKCLYTDISNPEMVDRLGLDSQKFTSTARATKTSKARRITREELEIEALQIILGSKADIEAVEKARILLDKELKNKSINIKNLEKASYNTKVKNQPTSKDMNFKILEALDKLRALPLDEEISQHIEMLESLL